MTVAISTTSDMSKFTEEELTEALREENAAKARHEEMARLIRQELTRRYYRLAARETSHD